MFYLAEHAAEFSHPAAVRPGIRLQILLRAGRVPALVVRHLLAVGKRTGAHSDSEGEARSAERGSVARVRL